MTEKIGVLSYASYLPYECWLQLRELAPEDRQIKPRGKRYGLTHNLGGGPGECVSFVAIVGAEQG